MIFFPALAPDGNAQNEASASESEEFRTGPAKISVQPQPYLKDSSEVK